MQAIIAQCDMTAFGQGSRTVFDATYRSAYQLPPARCVPSFHLAQPGSTILTDIARMLRPSASPNALPCVQAELYNLNVYAAGGCSRRTSTHLARTTCSARSSSVCPSRIRAVS